MKNPKSKFFVNNQLRKHFFTERKLKKPIKMGNNFGEIYNFNANLIRETFIFEETHYQEHDLHKLSMNLFNDVKIPFVQFLEVSEGCDDC